MMYEVLEEMMGSHLIGIIGLLIGIVCTLIGVVAILYMRYVAIQIELLRKDNERLWEGVGELRGALQLTRENYVSKKDFDGAVTRIFTKLDVIDGKFMRFLSSGDWGKRVDELEQVIRKLNAQRHDDR